MQAEVELKILRPEIADRLPAYATSGSAGLDLRACNAAPLTVQPGETVLIPTGIAGTVTNLRHRMVDLRVGLIVGASAAATAPAGRLVATLVSPSVGAILFNIFLLSIIASTILKMRKKSRSQG